MVWGGGGDGEVEGRGENFATYCSGGGANFFLAYFSGGSIFF